METRGPYQQTGNEAATTCPGRVMLTARGLVIQPGQCPGSRRSSSISSIPNRFRATILACG